METKFRGERLKTLRNCAGMTRETMGKSLGVSGFLIEDWENETAEPSIVDVYKIMREFGVSIEYLWGQSDSLF